MSAESAFEIFGIPGIIIFCLGAIGYKIYQHYDIKFASNDFLNQNFASKTLNSTWEYEPGIVSHYRRDIFAKEIEFDNNEDKTFKWEINIPQGRNNVYIYRNITEKPPSSNKGRYYLRVIVKNLHKNDYIRFEKKSFFIEDGKWVEPRVNIKVKEEICGNGVHYFEPTCRLDDIVGDLEDQKKINAEQIGIYVSSERRDVQNVIIEKAYFGEKMYMINLLPCISDKCILLVKPKDHSPES